MHEHFCKKATDDSLGSKEKTKFQGLAKKLESPVFVKNLGLMHDALDELGDMSVSLQKADITLPAAVKLINKQIEMFSARREYDSVHYSDACKAVELGQFKDVQLRSDNGKQPEIPKGQFYQALADAMTTRLLPESDRELIRAVEALNVSALPDDMSPEYGETEVRHVCRAENLASLLEM